MNLFFDPKREEYVIVSEGHVLKLNKKDFQSLKKTMNGISYALQMKCRRIKKEREEGQLRK